MSVTETLRFKVLSIIKQWKYLYAEVFAFDLSAEKCESTRKCDDDEVA